MRSKSRMRIRWMCRCGAWHWLDRRTKKTSCCKCGKTYLPTRRVSIVSESANERRLDPLVGCGLEKL